MNASKNESNQPVATGGPANPRIRLDNPDDPTAFLSLDEAQQATLLGYITNKWKPGKTVCSYSSYGLKHVFEESEAGFYVTNGQFKGAMQRAGLEPTDARKQNWLFKLAPAQPCAGRLKDTPYGSSPCWHKPDVITGLCSYHAERKRNRLPIDATVYPDRESWEAAMDARHGCAPGDQMRISDTSLVHEVAIVWACDVSNFPYVRQDIAHSGRRKGRIQWGGKGAVVVGWAELDENVKRNGRMDEFRRRVFWLAAHDRPFEPNGVYAHTKRFVPIEAVDPRTVSVRRAGVLTERAKSGKAHSKCKCK